MKSKPIKVLEIGIGNGFVSDYLKKRGINITTCDIDQKLNPDIVASVLNLPFEDEQFDVVACYEVLEHIPYDRVSLAISELARVSKKRVIISIPNISKAFPFSIYIPKIGRIYFFISVPLLMKKHYFDGEHYWELGKRSYLPKNFIKLLNKDGLIIENNYRVFELPYHHFFVCTKKQ